MYSSEKKMSMLDEIVWGKCIKICRIFWNYPFILFFVLHFYKFKFAENERRPTNLVFHVSKIFLKYFPVYNSIQDKPLISKEWKRIYQAAL